MNIKMTPVALAVAVTLAAPLAAHADGHAGSGFYGSVRAGVAYNDAGGDSDASLDIRSWASRFGFKAETDIGSGLTGFGKYEFGVNTSGSPSVRHANVGLKGDFGKLTLGQAYHTYYNNVVGPVDQAWWGSCNGCVVNPGRSTAATYEGNFGSGTAGISLIMDDDLPQLDGSDDTNELDGFEIGATYPVGDYSLGLGFRDIDDGSEAVIGLALSGNTSNVAWAFNVMSQSAPSNSNSDDLLGFDLHAGFQNAYVNIGTVTGDNDSVGFTLGYTKSIGEKTLSWFELQSFDSGVPGSDSSLALRAALKYDWN